MGLFVCSSPGVPTFGRCSSTRWKWLLEMWIARSGRPASLRTAWSLIMITITEMSSVSNYHRYIDVKLVYLLKKYDLFSKTRP